MGYYYIIVVGVNIGSAYMGIGGIGGSGNRIAIVVPLVSKILTNGCLKGTGFSGVLYAKR